MIYRHRRLLQSSTFDLRESELLFSHRAVLGNNFEMPFRLRELDPEPMKIWARNGPLTASIGIIAIAAASSLSVFSSTTLHLSDGALLLSLGVVLLAGLLGLIFLPFRVEVTAFRR